MAPQNLDGSLLPSVSPLPTKLLGSGPLPSLAASAEPPWGRQGRRHSGLRTAGARAAKYLLELSETDRHVGNLVRVGLGEAAGWAGRREVGSWGCLPRLLSPAETPFSQSRPEGISSSFFLPAAVKPGEWDCDPGWGLVTELTLGKGVPCEGPDPGRGCLVECGARQESGLCPMVASRKQQLSCSQVPALRPPPPKPGTTCFLARVWLGQIGGTWYCPAWVRNRQGRGGHVYKPKGTWAVR